MHFIGFIVFGALAIMSFPTAKKVWLSMAVICFGVLLDISQHFLTADRQLSLLDIAANISGGMAGIGIGLCLAYIFYKSLNLRQ